VANGFDWHVLSWFFCLAYFSALKIEAICSSETSIDFQLTKQRYIPENNTLQGSICYEFPKHMPLENEQ
jgi:hypothetical protein